LEKFDITNKEERFRALISWKTYLLDRMQEKSDNYGWRDKYDDELGSTLTYRHLRTPSDKNKS
jgi:hypothetical protein